MIILNKEMTKASIAEKIRSQIVAKYKHSNSTLLFDDFDFMLSVFSHHDGWEEKKGVGIKKIWCRSEYAGKSYCFYIERIDGTEIDISWRSCLYDKKDDAYENSAARNEVEYQLRAFREEHNTGEGVHLDHYPKPFCVIWSEFKLENKELDYKVINDGRKNMFYCKETAQKWKVYHAKNATLREISMKENISRGSGIENDLCPCGGNPKKVELNRCDGIPYWQVRCDRCGTFIRGIKKSEFIVP